MKKVKTNIVEIKDDIKTLNINHSFREVIKYNMDFILILIILMILFIVVTIIGKYCKVGTLVFVLEFFLAICMWVCMYVYSRKSIKHNEFNRGNALIPVYIAPLFLIIDSLSYLPSDWITNNRGIKIVILLVLLISILIVIYLSMKCIFCVYVKDNKLFIKTEYRKVKIDLSNIIKVYTNTKCSASNSIETPATRYTYFNIIYKSKKNKIRKFKKCVKVEAGNSLRNLKDSSIIISENDIQLIKNCFITTKDKKSKEE